MTMRSCLRSGLGIAMVLGLVACDEDVVGEWEAATYYCSDQRKDHFTIESDLTGDGTVVMSCADGDGPAQVCPAAMAAIARQAEGRWQLEADMGYCDALAREVGRHYKECQVRAEGDELRCCNPDGTNCLSYTRIE